MPALKAVTPVKTGVQKSFDFVLLLDSGFRRNDERIRFPTFYENITFDAFEFLLRRSSVIIRYSAVRC